MKQCKNCGTMNIDIYNYCSSCGQKLEQGSSAFHTPNPDDCMNNNPSQSSFSQPKTAPENQPQIPSGYSNISSPYSSGFGNQYGVNSGTNQYSTNTPYQNTGTYNSSYSNSYNQNFQNSSYGVQNTSNPNASSSPNTSNICNITFKRPNNVLYIANVFRIHIDNVRYDLRNNSEITIKLPRGDHHVEISVIAIPKKKKFNFSATEDMTFICSPNAASALSYLSAPVKVTGQDGKVY